MARTSTLNAAVSDSLEYSKFEIRTNTASPQHCTCKLASTREQNPYISLTNKRLNVKINRTSFSTSHRQFYWRKEFLQRHKATQRMWKVCAHALFLSCWMFSEKNQYKIYLKKTSNKLSTGTVSSTFVLFVTRCNKNFLARAESGTYSYASSGIADAIDFSLYWIFNLLSNNDLIFIF